MKGGRTAPRNFFAQRQAAPLPNRFNEGGADCPPKLSPCARKARRTLCFNEGGADCPPKPGLKMSVLQNSQRFNEGGADCPPKLLTLLVAIGLGEIGRLRVGGDFLFGK